MARKQSKKDVLIGYLEKRSAEIGRELIAEMLDDTGCYGTIEMTTAQVGRWMENRGLCEDYRDVLDKETACG